MMIVSIIERLTPNTCNNLVEIGILKLQNHLALALRRIYYICYATVLDEPLCLERVKTSSHTKSLGNALKLNNSIYEGRSKSSRKSAIIFLFCKST